MTNQITTFESARELTRAICLREIAELETKLSERRKVLNALGFAETAEAPKAVTVPAKPLNVQSNDYVERCTKVLTDELTPYTALAKRAGVPRFEALTVFKKLADAGTIQYRAAERGPIPSFSLTPKAENQSAVQPQLGEDGPQAVETNGQMEGGSIL